MASRHILLALLVLTTAAGLAAAAGPGDIAVFWGRNKTEGTLREACDTGTYNTVIISFLNSFGHGNKYTLDLSGHPLAGVGDDIKHCKSKGIVVLLSIGGPTGDYSLPSSQAATDLAGYLWHAFLGGAGVRRPFGDAAVDGVDFYIDHGPADHYDELARRLAGYGKAAPVTLSATSSARGRTGRRSRRGRRRSRRARRSSASWRRRRRTRTPTCSRRTYTTTCCSSRRSCPTMEGSWSGTGTRNRYYDKKEHYLSSS